MKTFEAVRSRKVCIIGNGKDGFEKLLIYRQSFLDPDATASALNLHVRDHRAWDRYSNRPLAQLTRAAIYQGRVFRFFGFDSASRLRSGKRPEPAR
jgi:hypothetical protein